MISKFNMRNIFLFDAIGAAVSFLLTGLILPELTHLIGLSKEQLYSIAVIPALLLIISLFSYSFSIGYKRFLLLMIILSNLAYTTYIISLIITSLEITLIGKLFFITESLIIMIICSIETKVLRRTF